MLRRSLLCRHEWSEIARMVSAYVPSYHTPLDLICNHLPEELATYVRRDAAAFFLRNPDLYDVVTHPRFGHTGTYIRYIGSLTDSPQENVDSKIDTSHSLRVDYKEYYIDPDTLLHLSLLLPNEYVTIMPATRKQIIYRRIPPLLSRSCAWKLSEIGAMYPKLFDVWDERTGQNCAVRMRSRVSQRTAFGKAHTSFMLSNILIVLKFIRAYVEQHQQSPSSQHSLSTPMQPVSLAILEETVRSDPRISNLMQDCIALPLARFLSYYSDTFTLTRDGNGVTVPIYAQNLEPQKLLTWFRPASVGALQDYLATHRDRLIPLVEQGPEGFVSRARPKSQKWGKKRRKEARDLVGVVTEEEARTLIKEIIEKIPVDETISFNTDLLPKLDNTLLLKTRSHSMSTIRFLKKFPELVIVEEHRGDHTVRRSVTEIPSEGVTTESVVKTEQGEAGDNIYMDVDTLIQVVLLDLERSPGTFKSIAGVNSSLPAPARKAVKTVYGTLSKFVESHSKYFIVKKVGDTKLISKAENDTVDNSLERNDLNF